LPALIRLNPGVFPALFGPSDDGTECVEIDDPEMITALETVRSALERRRPRRGRLRGAIVGGSAVAVAILAVFWLPAKLVDYTAAMLPAATRADLGGMALADLVKLTGSPCGSKPGLAAATALAGRLNAALPPKVVVLRDGLTRPLTLPGNIIALPAALLEKADGPDAIAGFVLVEQQRALTLDPTRALLQHAGLLATVRLLASGSMSPNALVGYGQTLMVPDPAPLSDTAVLGAFHSAGLSTTPYAYEIDPTGETSLPLIEADPFPGGSVPPVLDDAGWLELQAICTE
jgi:hypothetical protein